MMNPSSRIKYARSSCPTCQNEFLTAVDLSDLDLGNMVRTEKELVYPGYMPGKYCPDGNCGLGGVHPNENWKEAAGRQCKNCHQFAPGHVRKCAHCEDGYNTDFVDVTEQELIDAHIKVPNGGHFHG